MVPGMERVLSDLKMYTDLTAHYLWGRIVLKDEIFNLH